MKSLIGILFMLFALAAFAQQPPTPADPNAPALTLDEKIALATDDLKRQDALEKAQKAFMEATKPITDHQNATKKAIEDEHPGWQLEQGPQGWHLVKKPEPKQEKKP